MELALSGCTDATVRYIIRYHSDNGNELSVATANSQLNVIDLRPGKKYRFQIQCENSVGMTGPSVSTSVRTLSEGLFVQTFLIYIKHIMLEYSHFQIHYSWTYPQLQ